MTATPPRSAPVGTGASATHLPRGEASRRRLRRVFLDGFVALDVAEPLVSFDADRPADAVRAFMEARDLDRVGVRTEGIVRSYVERDDLRGGSVGDRARAFGPDDLVSGDASLQEVIRSLAINERCFVTVLDEVTAIVTLHDLEKPPVRMFIFGMITMLEMLMARIVEAELPGERWRSALAPGRLAKAEALQAERQRRGLPARLVDCLQFSDKGQLALKLMPARWESALGMSRKAALRALKELEELRNNLAHGQEIIPQGWARIAVFSSRLDQLLESL